MNPVIQLLPVSFGRDDFRYSLVKREGMVAIYHQTKAGYARGNYEVVRIQVNPAARIFGIDYPAREALPSSEQWGTDGFTYYDLSDAETKFNRLTRAAKSRAIVQIATKALANPDKLALLEERVAALEARVFREKRISPGAYEIYGLYPLKKGRPAALKAIQKCLDSGVPLDLLRQKTGAYRDARLAGGSLEYTPNPATWFNQERYNDPPETWANRQTRGMPSNPRELRARLSRLQDDYRMTSDLDQREDISEQINNVKQEIQRNERHS